MFQRLESVRLSDGAVLQIRTMLREGRLKVGDKLPGERQLTKQLGVSRASVREAVRILEGMGILTVRPGRGVFVLSDFQDSNMQALWMPWLMAHKNEIFDLLDAREAVEIKAARLAAGRISDSEIGQLGGILQQLKRLDKSDLEAIVGNDKAFHDLMYRSSKNRFLTTLNSSLHAVLDDTRRKIFAMVPDIVDSIVEQHSDILEALKKRDPAKVEEALANHMDSFREDASRLLNGRKGGNAGGA